MHVHRLWPVLLALVLGCDAGERQPSALESERIAQADRAREAERQDALDAERAAARLELLAFDLDRFDQDISRAVTMVADAMTPSQSDAAKTRLRELQVEQANLKRRIAEARADHEKARRHRSLKLTIECRDNPLSKGCL